MFDLNPTRAAATAVLSFCLATGPVLVPAALAEPAAAAHRAQAATVSAGQGRGGGASDRDIIGGNGSNNGSGTVTGCSTSAWNSNEIQQQIGSKNKDKKKLVMQVWFTCWNIGGDNWKWQLQYTLKSEDKDRVGSGWHPGAGATMVYTAVYKTGATTHTWSSGPGGDTSTAKSVSSQVVGLANLPVFTTRSFRGSRPGGPSGISIQWP